MSSIEERALRDLDWSAIEQAVGRHRRALVHGEFRLPLAGSVEAARDALAETGEVLGQIHEETRLPLDGICEIRPHLSRVERQGALDLAAIGDLRSSLRAARVLRRHLSAQRAQLPRLARACAMDPALDNLLSTIEGALDPEGTLADHASDELRRLRTETRNLRARLVGRLESLVVELSDLLSDRLYTQREGRYVLPVRADAHERVHGIVHGSSASGATIFVEPRGLVEGGNRLKLAEAEQAREQARILAQISELVAERAASLRAAFDALLHADLRHACACLAGEIGGLVPDFEAEPVLDLRAARHPLLCLEGVEVVPNDLAISAGEGLVISGPNAGGKTVALKILGLFALMSRAGLPLPVGEGSRVGFFGPVLTDIGDQQSLERNLSTFSAHVENLREIIDAAGRGTLVLLDELAGSTDPGEGAALACAVTERLCAEGAAVAVTTHYEPLKAHVLTTSGMRNASVGFDVERMQPTFRLRMDVPGASSALSVAHQHGLSPRVLERAAALVPEHSRQFDQLVRRLEQIWEQLDARQVELEDELKVAREARARVDEELAALRARDRKRLQGASEKLMSALTEARQQVEQVRRGARRKNLDAGKVRDLSRALDEVASTVNANPEVQALQSSGDDDNGVGAALDPATIEVGQRVYVEHLRAEADVLGLDERGRVRVAAGAMKLWVDASRLRATAESQPTGMGGAGAARAARRASASSVDAEASAIDVPAHQTPDNSLDLRGMRVEDALGLLESFLDGLYGRSLHHAFVQHGIGAGALRDAVRKHLAVLDSYVASFRPGNREEGGDRVTVVTLC